MHAHVPKPRPERVPLSSAIGVGIPAIDIVDGELLPRGDDFAAFAWAVSARRGAGHDGRQRG
ncbi:hypothetical protein ACFM35_10460 [Microbacterium sp. P01]|uniref:hypothetical protein n=1 Tax=Microbacterium sp. P01 TaxID=3366261 RepID=UPI0036714047